MERQGKNGPTMSKHGSVMHCSHCSEAGHNKAACNLKKMGYSEEEAKTFIAATQAALQKDAEEQAMTVAADQVNENETPDPLNNSTTQPPPLEDMNQATSTVLSQMLGEVKFLTHVLFVVQCMPWILHSCFLTQILH